MTGLIFALAVRHRAGAAGSGILLTPSPRFCSPSWASPYTDTYAFAVGCLDVTHIRMRRDRLLPAFEVDLKLCPRSAAMAGDMVKIAGVVGRLYLCGDRHSANDSVAGCFLQTSASRLHNIRRQHGKTRGCRGPGNKR